MRKRGRVKVYDFNIADLPTAMARTGLRIVAGERNNKVIDVNDYALHESYYFSCVDYIFKRAATLKKRKWASIEDKRQRLEKRKLIWIS